MKAQTEIFARVISFVKITLEKCFSNFVIISHGQRGYLAHDFPNHKCSLLYNRLSGPFSRRFISSDNCAFEILKRLSFKNHAYLLKCFFDRKEI